MSTINWCRFFAFVEENPAAIVPQITIRQLHEAQEHVRNCDSCNLRVQRVAAIREPKTHRYVRSQLNDRIR